jgi:prepilin-type N-terminal cleavage/methylation domain-containing protein
MKTHSSTAVVRRGFTLVEMLAVITIIVILAALTVGGMGYVREKQARSQARVQIDLLSNAIEEYKQDFGNYPYGGNAAKGDSNILFKALYWDSDDNGSGPDADLNQKIYLADLDPTTNKQKWIDGQKATAKIVDPWGNEYYFRSGKTSDGKPNPGAVNPDFDIWSSGPDGKTSKGAKNDSTKDDISNF